ncbi:ralBP1-associated Eps domain-containing protein 1 isoform X1 [Bactrocera neohumeralis]|uniref:ralBP1-associated Eps domain-containing protein 1 isoform X1 n=1 Tax=Bactrocera neohumeralis TaxID=98809 RepID=UPI00216594AC|nr:ralBP1-associated Eps domain-containing protein 1 isoform X1 [Bactrocera neohumeralis]
MEVHLNETESRYFSDLFLCCDVEKVGKISILKAKELYRSANLQNDKILEITALVGIPSSAIHISRAQFYSCLKLIAAFQAGLQLRQEIITSTLHLPLPRFSWKDSPSNIDTDFIASGSRIHQCTNESNLIPPPPVSERKNSLPQKQKDWMVESCGSNTLQKTIANRDVASTDSEIDHNESNEGISANRADESGSSGHETLRLRGSPEAWSTNSDSPTPTNSVTDRQWAKETLWQGLLGDEHRQLLGTEEESSDRHSSEDENDLESVYQITPEQRDYYYKQFKSVQHDNKGFISGQVARNICRVFFEKSRIPVEELKHIWQLCDVSRDGALSLAEFIAAMHLVVLRRNNIPLPAILPSCLHPTILQFGSRLSAKLTLEPPEADLLHLNDDEEEDKTDNTVIAAQASTVKRIISDKNGMDISTLSTSSQASNGSRQGNQPSLTPPSLAPPVKNRSISNSPIVESNTTPPNLTVESGLDKTKDRNLWAPTDIPPSQWTKFTESPTSNVSSPGPKPVNFDMQRTAQAVVSDPQILHPVPLRVTPVAGTLSGNAIGATETVNQDVHELPYNKTTSPKQMSSASTTTIPSNSNNNNPGNIVIHNRESLQANDLRAIQRPQAKKLLTKNIGALPPPPQREPCISSNSGISAGNGDDIEIVNSGQKQQLLQNKKDPPPLPPPRPHRHGRSSSLDLNKFKISTSGYQQTEITAQASFDLQTSTGFADFTQFYNNDLKDADSDQQQYCLPQSQQTLSSLSTIAVVAMPPTRVSLQQSNQRVSAFEVYRKPNTPRSSQSPIPGIQLNNRIQQSQPLPPMSKSFGAIGNAVTTQHLQLVNSLPNADMYEKRINAISETLKHVSFRQDNSMGDVLRHLREQNNILLRLCNDLSDELLSVQARKEELRVKMEAFALTEFSIRNCNHQQTQIGTLTNSSTSEPVSANLSGASGNSGIHSNV